MAVFGAEALLNTEYIPKAGQAGLEIELRTLSQECWLAVVIKFKKGGTSLYLRLDKAGGSNLEQRMLGVCLAKS